MFLKHSIVFLALLGSISGVARADGEACTPKPARTAEAVKMEQTDALGGAIAADPPTNCYLKVIWCGGPGHCFIKCVCGDQSAVGFIPAIN